MCNSGLEVDKHGNIYHPRHGIIAYWVEDNPFTGEGHHIPNRELEPDEPSKKEVTVKIIKGKIVKCRYFGKDFCKKRCKNRHPNCAREHYKKTQLSVTPKNTETKQA